jgi:hypothetical protein
MKRRVEILAGEGRIEAVLGEPTTEHAAGTGKSWSGPWAALRAHGLAGRLLGAGAIFDAELTARWGRLVACSPEFSTWWRARPDAPEPKASFFLEVTSHV